MKKIILILVPLLFLVSCKTEGFPQKQYDKAYEQLINQDYSKASKSFEKILKNKSEYPEIWFNYGCCLMETNQFSESIEAFTKTTELYENSVMYDDKLGLKHDAMTSIGEVYLLQKDFENAEKQFEKCLAEKKDREMINAILAVYIRLGFVDEAEEYFNDKGINIWMM